jgi:hypothetical protein
VIDKLFGIGKKKFFFSRLIKIWKEIFSTEISIEQYPMLIGIMRRCATEKTCSSTSEYVFLPLLKGDTLIRTKEKFSPKSVLNELSKFREECDENERALVSRTKNQIFIYLLLISL